MKGNNIFLTLKLFLLASVLTVAEYFLVVVALPWLWVEIYQGSFLMMTLIMLTIIGCLPMFCWGFLVCIVGWYGLGAWIATFKTLFA